MDHDQIIRQHALVTHGIDIQIGLLPGEGVKGHLELMVLAFKTRMMLDTSLAEHRQQTPQTREQAGMTPP